MRKLVSRSILSSLLASMAVLVGCEVTGNQSRTISVSHQTARALKNIDSVLRSEGAELSFKCFDAFWNPESSICHIRIDGNRYPRLDAELINHPFENRPLVLRLHGGTQKLQGGLYKALAAYSPTRDFQGSLDERKLELERNRLRFRCVSTRDAAPAYECWTLIGAELLN